MASKVPHAKLAVQGQPPLGLDPSTWTRDHWHALSLKAGYSKEHWKAVAGITEAQYEEFKNEVKKLIDKHSIRRSAVTTEKRVLYGDVEKILRRAIKLPTFTNMPWDWWKKVLKKCADDINRYHPAAKASKASSLFAAATRDSKSLERENSTSSHSPPVLRSGLQGPKEVIHNTFAVQKPSPSGRVQRPESMSGTSLGRPTEQDNGRIGHAAESARSHERTQSVNTLSNDDARPDAPLPTKPTFSCVPLFYAVVEVEDSGIIELDIQFIDLAFDNTNEWNWRAVIQNSGIYTRSQAFFCFRKGQVWEINNEGSFRGALREQYNNMDLSNVGYSIWIAKKHGGKEELSLVPLRYIDLAAMKEQSVRIDIAAEW